MRLVFVSVRQTLGLPSERPRPFVQGPFTSFLGVGRPPQVSRLRPIRYPMEWNLGNFTMKSRVVTDPLIVLHATCNWWKDQYLTQRLHHSCEDDIEEKYEVTFSMADTLGIHHPGNVHMASYWYPSHREWSSPYSSPNESPSVFIECCYQVLVYLWYKQRVRKYTITV